MGFNGAIAGGAGAAGATIRALRTMRSEARHDLEDYRKRLQTCDPALREAYRLGLLDTETYIQGLERVLRRLEHGD